MVDRAAPVPISKFLQGLQATPGTEPALRQARERAAAAEELASPGGTTLTSQERSQLRDSLGRVTLRGASREAHTTFANLQRALREPGGGRTILQIAGTQVRREAPTSAEVIPAEPKQELLAGAGWRPVDGDPSRVRHSDGRTRPVGDVLTDLQRTRPVPINVTLGDRALAPMQMRFDGSQRLESAHATTRPSSTDYQLIPNASIDGVERFGVRANPLHDRIRDAIRAAGPELYGTTDLSRPENLVPFVRRLTVNAFDGYNPVLEGDDLRTAITQGAFLQSHQRMAGQRFPGDGRWEISPVLAARPPTGSLGNPWAVSHIDIELQPPPR